MARNSSEWRMGRSFPKVFERRACEERTFN